MYEGLYPEHGALEGPRQHPELLVVGALLDPLWQLLGRAGFDDASQSDERSNHGAQQHPGEDQPNAHHQEQGSQQSHKQHQVGLWGGLERRHVIHDVEPFP